MQLSDVSDVVLHIREEQMSLIMLYTIGGTHDTFYNQKQLLVPASGKYTVMEA